MNGEAIARYILFGLVLTGCIVLLAIGTDVPAWLESLALVLGGNTARLQVTAAKKE